MNNLAITSLLARSFDDNQPCILPLYPGFLAYLSGQSEMGLGKQRYFLGFFVLAGVLTMMLALGGLIALLAVPVGSVLVYVIPLADLLIFLLGILLLLNRNPFKTLPQIQLPALRHPYRQCLCLWFALWSDCASLFRPMVVSIFALSFTAGEAFSQLWVFLWFGIGTWHAPVDSLAALGAFQRQLTISICPLQPDRLISSGGLLLVGIAIYDLSKNWELMRLFYYVKTRVNKSNESYSSPRQYGPQTA